MTFTETPSTAPVCLRAGDTVERAAELLVRERVLALPVVDGSGRLVGTFGVDDLSKLLLPRAVTLGVGLEELRERMAHVCHDPVADHLGDGANRVLHPDSSFTEALFLLHRSGRDLPVVDPSTGNLVRMVSPWDVLARLG